MPGSILVQTQNLFLILSSEKEQLLQKESLLNSISQKVLQNFVARKTFECWSISEHCITVCQTCLQILVYRSQHSFGSFFGLCSFLTALTKHIWMIQPCVAPNVLTTTETCAHIFWGSKIPTHQSWHFCRRSLSAGPVFFVYPKHQPRQKDYNYWAFPVVLVTYINICSI